MTNDQNIVRGRHLDSLAADAKRFTLEQNLALNQAIQAELAELDTGTSYDVFTGATSITGGLSGLVPAPQAGDEFKSLRGDGTWSGEIILPTVSNSVDGGFWLDVSGTPPVPNFYYGGTTYMFDVSPLPSGAEFTVTPSTVTIADFDDLPVGETLSFTFSYRGEPRTPTLSGKIIDTSGYMAPWGYTVDATALKFTHYREGGAVVGGPDSPTLTFTLPATSEYPAATATLTYVNFDPEYMVDI